MVTDAELVAEAATALTVVVAGAAIRFARARAVGAVAATALSALGADAAILCTRRRAWGSANGMATTRINYALRTRLAITA